jgi:hypothetical protein
MSTKFYYLQSSDLHEPENIIIRLGRRGGDLYGAVCNNLIHAPEILSSISFLPEILWKFGFSRSKDRVHITFEQIYLFWSPVGRERI